MRTSGSIVARFGLLALVAWASSCGGRTLEIAREKSGPAAVVAPAPAPRAPPPVDATVLGPESLPALTAPTPWNPEADVDRAGILAEGAEGSGEIVLTFDDGPAAETTLEVLRILDAHKVKGAFFLTGRRLAGDGVVSEMNRGVARAIVAAGHTIGNHALDHLAVNRKDAAWNAFQIEESARLISEATAQPVHYFRPPYGKVGPAAQQLLAARRDELVMWTIDAQDTKETDPERLTRRLIAQIVFAGQGVVLLHDLRGSSVRALSLLLDWLERHPRDPATGTGYGVVDLPTYLAHAAARPWPYATRLQLYHAREKQHALERPRRPRRAPALAAAS
ncbi:MAG: polysaccharide deacetylase family protein [Deltaproteobacteria bacterium]|nr:polysaccharide deacetylase family protein [Deltaproteobacteria bacterium]